MRLYLLFEEKKTICLYSNRFKLGLHIAICLTDSFHQRYAMQSVNFIAMRCESTRLKGIAADKSHCVTLALDIW